MAKKEKIAIQKDKRMEPIDNELDAAMGLLENANRQINDLLASFVPPSPETPEGAEGAVAPAELDVEEKSGAEAKEAPPEAKEGESAPKEE